MGIDINGWVEVRHGSSWYGVIKIGNVADRSYDMFSSLFGIASFATFIPIAPERGLPADISEDASDDYLTWEEPFGETWVLWTEVQRINWVETALDSRPHEYRLDADNQLVYEGKAAPRAGTPTDEGATWKVGEQIFRIERITRRSALETSQGWRLLFHLASVLAARRGDENVRLVVWFDS